MKLYHGSKSTNNKIINRDENRDFGKGVYLTTNKEQAEEWAGQRKFCEWYEGYR